MTWILEILAVAVPLFHIVGIGFAIHATLWSRTSQGAIAWGVSLVVMPYVSVPLYLVFGRAKFHGYVAERRAGDRRIDHVERQLAGLMEAVKASPEGDVQRLGVLETLAGMPFTAGNSARLLVDGTDTFAAIFAAIEAAEKYVLVQFFIVRDDALGRELKTRLIAKAKAGVRVLFLYDEIGSIGLPHRYRRELRAAGVAVAPFRTSRGLKNRFQINFRNHRKIVIIDGHAAFVGGHNVGVEYIGQCARFGHWRDTHVEVRGPAVGAIQLTFLRDWHWATGEIPELDWSLKRVEEDLRVLAVATSPADDVESCTLLFLAAISSARERVWITSPYFVPDETVFDALQLAALRGVDVRIMLPNKADHLLVYLSAFSFLEAAERVGVKFYRYQAGFLHQKVMLIDEKLASVGTANMDNRSFRLNFEITVLCADSGFAKAVAGMLERDFADCKRATPGDLMRRGLVFRVAVRMARLFSPIQ